MTAKFKVNGTVAELNLEVLREAKRRMLEWDEFVEGTEPANIVIRRIFEDRICDLGRYRVNGCPFKKRVLRDKKGQIRHIIPD